MAHTCLPMPLNGLGQHFSPGNINHVDYILSLITLLTLFYCIPYIIVSSCCCFSLIIVVPSPITLYLLIFMIPKERHSLFYLLTLGLLTPDPARLSALRISGVIHKLKVRFEAIF